MKKWSKLLEQILQKSFNNTVWKKEPYYIFYVAPLHVAVSEKHDGKNTGKQRV